VCVLAICGLVAGGATNSVAGVAVGYGLLWFSLKRSKALLRAIDAGELEGDGRTFASLAWIFSMAGSGLAIVAFAAALF